MRASELDICRKEPLVQEFLAISLRRPLRPEVLLALVS